MCGCYTNTADVQQRCDRFKVPIESAAGARRSAEGGKGVFLWLSWARRLLKKLVSREGWRGAGVAPGGRDGGGRRAMVLAGWGWSLF